MARYFLTKEKLRKYLILITLKGHQWDLRSSDHNFVGVVKVNLWSVVKSLDPPWDHSKNQIHNLFAIFFEKVTSCLAYIFEIRVEERLCSLVIIPNHKPLKGSLLS